MVFKHIHETVVVRIGERGIHGYVSRVHFESVTDFIFRHFYFLRNLLYRRTSLVFLFKLGQYLIYFVYRSHLVKWHSYQSALFRQGLQYALSYPPYSIWDKFEATCLVKLLGGSYQSHITLVDEVGQAETLVLILLGNRYDKPEVGLHQAFKGFFVPLVYSLCEFHLFIHCKQFFPTYFR